MFDVLRQRYAAKTTQELEKIIRLDIESDDGQELEYEELIAIIDVLRERGYAEEYIKAAHTWEDFCKCCCGCADESLDA